LKIKIDEKWWKRITVGLISILVLYGVYTLTIPNMIKGIRGEGYIIAVNNILNEVLTKGIVNIPINDTASVPLILPELCNEYLNQVGG